MQLDVEALRRNDPDALKQLWKDCHRCAVKVGGKIGALSFIEDIAQDMVMVILTTFLDKYEVGREVEPFLNEMARRMGLRYYHQHSREDLQGDYQLDVSNEDVEDGQEADAVKRSIELDAESARKALMARMKSVASKSQVSDSRGLVPIAVKPPRVPSARREAIRNTQKARSARPEVKELATIRKQLGLTQIEMSIALGEESQNKVRTIEYGVVVGDVDDLLIKARRLLEEHQRQLGASDSIDKHIGKWCTSLGLAHDDFEGLAARIGIHRSTLFRWRTGKTSPKPHQVRHIDALVEAVSDAQ